MEEGATRTDHDEKETPVSTSPDSGICDLDSQPEEQTKPSPPEATSSPPIRTKPFPEGRFRYNQSYDPFFFKYATDNRKLTLLKSLSQDSEYSLDTSLFDAEEFLADMGFAGGSDPTIPDRFLPSLMQRLSKFPESEMESLHHRIVQSIGCFRRKEGKRRLFRNLSMSKGSSVDHFGKNHLPCPSNNYPLLRSNTGPAEFSFDDATTSTYEINNNSLKSGRLSSSDSGHHSMDSLKNEGEFPESPIAILVSSASVEQEDKSLEACIDKEVQVLMNDEVPVDDLSTDSETTAKQISDGEFINTVQEIQKLTDDISESDNLVSLTKDSDFVTDRTEKDSQNASGNTEESLADSKYVRSNSVEENSPEVLDETSNEAEKLASSSNTDKPALTKNTAMSSPAKRPLRRISNAQSYNPLRHSKGFGSLEHQNNINEDEDLDYELFGFPEPTPTVKENNNFNSINNHNPFKTVELYDVSAPSGENCNLSNTSISNFESLNSNTTDSIPFSSNDKYFNFSLPSNTDSSPFHSNNIDSSKMAPHRINQIDSKSEKETHSFSKPKFNRDDSLTNFLSSMLDMSEKDSALKSPLPRLNSLLENQSKSDSEVLPDNFSSEKFPVQYNFTKAQSTEALTQTQSFSPFGQNLNSEVKSVPDRSPNRKRRVLRRMSSSLQCYDDDNYEDPNKSAVAEGFQFSPTNPFLSPKLPLRHTKSGLHDSNSGHRLVQPCNSLPPMKLFNPYKIQNDINRCTNPFTCTLPEGVQSNSDPEATKVYNHKKEKRNCKKRRYLPSADSDLYSNPWIRAGSREFPKFNTCDDMCNHKHLQDTIFDCNQTHRYYVCSCREANSSRIHFDEPYPECDHFYQRESMASCTNCNSLSCHAYSPPHCRHSRNPISHGLPLKGSYRHYLWNSTPDVRFGYCNSAFKDYRGRPKLNSLHDLSKDHCENISPASSFCDETRFSDDAFFSEKVPYCFAHSSPIKQPETVKPSNSRKLKVRMPQRQHSMSIDDPDDHPFPNRKVSAHRGNFQNSPLSKSGLLSGDSSSNPSSPPDGPSRKASIVASPPNVPDVLQKKMHNNDKSPSSSQMAQLPSFDSKTDKVKNGPQSPIKKNKNEELLERKIRIFSKFFTNLGNLSKSVQDRHSDNEHKEKRDARFYDVIGTDKPRKPSIRNVFPRKCSTPPPEYYRQIDLHKTQSSSFGSSDESDSSPRTVRKLEHPIYENRVVLQPVSTVGKKQRHFKPLEFTSSVSMYINSEENKGQSNVHRKDDLSEMSSSKDASSTKSDENSRNSSQMSFKVVTKELEDLQQSIQKAKEMRISASKELHLLQELLSGDDNTEGRSEAAKEKKFPTVHPAVHLKDTTFSSKEIEEKQALKDLREKSKKEVLEDTSFWQEEIRKVKEETNQAWQEKLDRLESLLTSQEEELHRLQSENENLQKNSEFQRLGSPTCHCRSESGQNGFGRIDSAFEDDEEYFSHKPSIPIQSTRQECDRLQERLTEEEQRADQLKLLLNQKLIDFNKLQITLSKQTKEMIELEKSYLQLQCRLRKGTSKPMVARLCARTSPFNSKNLCPKPSPPATPQPNGVS